MDFQDIAQTIGHNVVMNLADEIYKQIIWNHIVYAAKVGILAGLVMAAIAMVLAKLNFTKLDLTTYTGCLLTTNNKGAAPFIAGVLFHLIVSALFGVAYLYLIHKFQIPGTLMYGVILGLAHTAFSGSLMIALDHLHPCVETKMIGRMGFAASAQGRNAVITYVLTHVVYAVIVLHFLTH